MSAHTMRMRHPARAGDRRRTLAMVLVAAMLAYLVQVVLLPAPSAQAATVGAGSYGEGTPAGGAVPTECNGTPVTNPRAHVTANFPAGAIPTNDWWTSLLWRKFDCASISENLMAHPLAFHAFTDGLGVSYPTTASISGTSTGVGEYHYSYAEDFRLGIAGLTADGKVDGYSDWTVSELWSAGGSSLRTTFGHGLPFVYATKTGGDATLRGTAAPTVWSTGNGAVGFTINGHDYAAFGPTGSTWSVSGTTLRSSLAGGSFFSVAVLPTSAASSNAERTAALAAYAPYAHNHVTGTKVSWSYDEASARMTATYAFTTTARQGNGTGTVYALYPHQRDQLAGATPSAYSYVSPRGPMRVVVGSSQFQTVATFNGVLPQLANTGFAAGSADANQLNGYIEQVAAGDPFAGFGEDTYWTGKAFGRISQVAQMANLTGNTPARDRLVAAMRTRLTDWMTASPGETGRSFWYNPAWGTLIGYPASYGSDTDLNDHHFHYGYYVVGAATVAQFDPAWAATSAYGGMVNTVIKDAANWDRTDTRFPFLRDFDIYAGHDWAAGHGAFGAGNNQESSSEGMNFASGLIQWGQVTGNTAVRDLGIYLYTTQASAIENYWFDTDDEAFPAAFGHSTVGMVWGDGGAYSTWFSAEPEMIQGINLLPSTAGHLYLGYDPAYVRRNIAELERNNGGPAQVWKDIIWEFQALADAPTALSQFRSQANTYAVEEGESRAHTFYWLKNLEGLGTVDRSVTASTPLHAVFVKNGVRTYQAANMSSAAITVRFSNGVTLNVPARSVASSNTTAPTDTTAPSVPANLAASGTTSSATTLTWSASTDNAGGTGVARYEVLRNGSVVGSPTGTSYTATGLAASTTYQFAVRAVDGAGNRSAAGAAVSVTTTGGGQTPVGSPITGPGGKCVDVAGNDTGGNLAAVQLWDCQPAAVDQHWTLTGGTLRTLGKCLDIEGNGTANGTKLILWDCTGGGNQEWVPQADGSVKNPRSGRCLDSPGGSTANGARLQIWDCNGTAAQKFASALFAGTGGGFDATSRIQAEAYDGMAGVFTETTTDADGGQNIAGIANGDHVRFDGVRFGSTPRTQFSARVASGAAGGVSGLVNVRLDSPTGPSIGSFAIGSTGGWQTWRTVPATIQATTGTHTVYLTFDSGQPADFVNVNWFTFG